MPNAEQIMDALAELLAPKVAALLVDQLPDAAPQEDPGNGWEDNPAPDEPPADDDPWGAPEPTRQPPKRNSAPRGSGSRNQRSNGGGNRPTNRGGAARGGSNRGGGNGGGAKVPTSGVFSDEKGKDWEFGLDTAPECEHGEPCAEVTKPGANWRAWACPHGFKDWRNKCDTWTYQD